ncbi:AimR family lysis-lysogeny pheromone receptor [Peribacillus frigoritolerans]|uniref:AimR family lysis-lysogeny pheromone receptor n=1 Tax=Peribacillus frigoritolerans TaxID=450367 RepID=UPI0007BEC11A
MLKRSLKQLLLVNLENSSLSPQELAEKAGYASVGNFKKVLHDEKRDFGNFNGLLKVIRQLFPEKEYELMSEYASKIDPSKSNARQLVEYFDNNNLIADKRKLISRMLDSNNSTSRQFAEIYNIDDQYVSKDITFFEALSLFGGIKPKTSEVSVGLKLFRGYAFLDEQMFNMFDECIANLDLDIVNVSEDYFRESYYGRFMILSIITKIGKGLITEARALCVRVLHHVEDDYFKALASLHMGNTYMLESCEKASEYYNSGLWLAQDDRCDRVRNNLMKSLNFLYTLNGKEAKYLNFFSENPSDMHEVAFHYINVNKQPFKALEILNAINMETLNDFQKAFHHYYRGLIDGSVKNFSLSVTYFRKAGDHHYRGIPLLELQKMGIDTDIIQALAQ